MNLCRPVSNDPGTGTVPRATVWYHCTTLNQPSVSLRSLRCSSTLSQSCSTVRHDVLVPSQFLYPGAVWVCPPAADTPDRNL